MKARTKGKKMEFQSFFDLEKELDLFSLQFQGVHYWQLVRFGVHSKVYFSKYNVATVAEERQYTQEVSTVLTQALRMLFKWRRFQKTDVIRLRPLVERVVAGESSDHQYDYYSMESDIRVTDVYTLGRYGDIPDHAAVTLATAEAKVVLWKIKRKLFGAREIDESQKVILKDFLDRLKNIYGVEISLDSLTSQIQYVVNCFLHYRNTYLKLFKKMSPSAIMLYPNYDDHMYPAVSAARELGIASIELQHGEIIDHGAYWYEDTSEMGKYLPDYLFSYGQWWIDNVQLPECVKPVAIGNPYLEYQVKKYPPKENGKTVTFFSNVISGLDLVELIESCYDEIVGLGYKVVFKLHPREVKQWRENYPFLASHPEIQVVESGSIYQLISETTVIMGLRSTVFYEALVYPHVVIALDPKGGMKPLLNYGLAKAVCGKEDLLKVLKEPKSTRDGAIDITDVWNPSGAENTAAFLKTLIH